MYILIYFSLNKVNVNIYIYNIYNVNVRQYMYISIS